MSPRILQCILPLTAMLMAGCLGSHSGTGGGGGGTMPTAANTTPLVVDAGPAALPAQSTIRT